MSVYNINTLYVLMLFCISMTSSFIIYSYLFFVLNYNKFCHNPKNDIFQSYIQYIYIGGS